MCEDSEPRANVKGQGQSERLAQELPGSSWGKSEQRLEGTRAWTALQAKARPSAFAGDLLCGFQSEGRPDKVACRGEFLVTARREGGSTVNQTCVLECGDRSQPGWLLALCAPGELTGRCPARRGENAAGMVAGALLPSRPTGTAR